MPDQTLLAALKQHFRFDAFRPGQLEAMRHVMRGRDSLIVMPTGAGKSLCFQLPALLLEGVTLVISPLIALMKDQVDALQANGMAATFINSSLDGTEQGIRLHGLANGQWKLCYIAPERLRNQGFREAVRRARVALLAVDEAHCISQWGHDFRPDYHAIGDFVELLGRPPITALTATATPQVQDDIEKQLHLQNPFRQVTGFNRPNLRFDACFTPGDTLKQQMLKAFLEEQPEGTCGIVYVGRRREATDVASFVRELCERSAVFYHGGMSGWERETVQEDWMHGRASIVVATNAFGMGVDKPDVRFVVHYTIPGTLEAYYQEAGRAGRDGEPAHCLVLYDPGDARLHEWFIENDAPTLDELRDLYVCVRDEARRNGGRIEIALSHLATLLEWRMDHKARIGMSLLEQAGLVEDLGEEGNSGCWRLLEAEGRVDMSGPMHDIELRRTQKRRLLGVMMEYAQTHDCRRQYLLDYFGDATPPVAEWCCDNCQRQEERTILGVASSPEEKAPLYVLDAVNYLRSHRDYGYGVGRSLLAKLLAGSRGAGMERYFEHPQYGILSHVRQKDVQRLIDDLVRERYLQIESGRYPTLSLTPSGRQVVERRLAVPITTITGEPIPTAKKLSAKRVTDTVVETLHLMERGHTPDEIAVERGLTIGTIY
ncbi:MAG: RecQ family ATP-dependent DNA helicase, partial [Chloroflexota bacterium]|nr:RecQ family ATP-dependent DNA helicase [Chloroflexota bacterium]